jgi:hypothetical protein
MKTTLRLTVFSALAVAALSLAPAPAQAAGPFQFHAITPCRVFDTREAGGQTTGAPLSSSTQHLFRIQGQCGVPVGAKAVSLNLTVVGPTRGGDMRLYPANVTPTLNDPSTLNYNQGEPALANGAILPLAPVVSGSDKDVKILIGMIGTGTVHALFDVTGYFQ